MKARFSTCWRNDGAKGWGRETDAQAAWPATLKKQGFAPDVVVTDKLRSYGAAKSEIGLSARHEQGLRKNNRAESSHQPTRRRERKMRRFKSPGSANDFWPFTPQFKIPSTFSAILPLAARSVSSEKKRSR
jgi:transposase-like protein